MSEDGELSFGLPGEGKPLDLWGDEQAGDRWAAFHILSKEKLLPGWAQLRREIDDDRADQLRALPADRIMDAARATGREEAPLRAEVASRVAALNVEVGRFNSLAPVASLRLAPLSAERFFEPERA